MSRSSLSLSVSIVLLTGLACTGGPARDPCADADACCDIDLQTGKLAPIPLPEGGVVVDQVIRASDGTVYGCCGGGNWCADAGSSPAPGRRGKAAKRARGAAAHASEVMGVPCNRVCTRAQRIPGCSTFSGIFNPPGSVLDDGTPNDCVTLCMSLASDPSFVSLAPEDVPCVMSSATCEEWIACAQSGAD